MNTPTGGRAENAAQAVSPMLLLQGIPTNDAEAALAFCRALALLTGQTLSAPQPVSPPASLSVVIPVYNEQENLRELYARLVVALERIGDTFEIICFAVAPFSGRSIMAYIKPPTDFFYP